MKKAEPERVVHLALSQDAARLLNDSIQMVQMEHVDPGESADILAAIQRDISDQLPKRKRART